MIRKFLHSILVSLSVSTLLAQPVCEPFALTDVRLLPSRFQRNKATKDDPSRVALMYGPIVLGGRLADVAHPFSDPKKHNDYYTFDYGKHSDITLGEVKYFGGLKWSMEPSIIRSAMPLRSAKNPEPSCLSTTFSTAVM